ncbi:hypothetical protein, variant [Fonticula alba]|uniref:Regulator of chromosome condensation n=1 Tax=Fonticula alba TaxID=691883 RepID=A0A058ZER9_FONAL|nr:hypothetical protein, variant [Fonticula alba]KCV72418.1 hypothetical protein, variant [Fonticula alba]|eukprot:XP_009492119.1 hypothetical protein, variant [Fonticula alba]
MPGPRRKPCARRPPSPRAASRRTCTSRPRHTTGRTPTSCCPECRQCRGTCRMAHCTCTASAPSAGSMRHWPRGRLPCRRGTCSSERQPCGTCPCICPMVVRVSDAKGRGGGWPWAGVGRARRMLAPAHIPMSPSSVPSNMNACLPLSRGAAAPAAVNARGDVYQWGVDSPAPVLTLRGLDAVQVETAGQAPLSVALTRQGSIVVLSPIDAPPADHTATLTIANTGLASYLYPTKTITAEGVSHVLVCPEEPTIKFSKISVGDHHLLAVSTCGRLFSCPLTEKANAFGQLGLGTMGDVPTEDLFILRPVIGLPASHGVADVATGAGHSLAACDSGLVYAFGDNRMQQLTLGHIRMKSRSLTSFPEPTLCRGLPLLASDQWVSRTLAAGGKPDPEQPALPQQVVRLAAGGDTSAFVVIDRDPTPRYNVLVSGFGQFGQLGSGSFLHSVGRAHTVRNLSGLTSMDEATRTRQPIPIRTLSVSLGHCAAILDTTTPTGLPSRYIPPLDAFLWGDNRAGQLGNGLRAMVGVPWQPSERVLSPKKQDGSPAPRPEDLRDLPAVTGTPGHRFDLTCSPTATFVFLAADSR